MQTDDELWLRSDGEIFILAFRIQQDNDDSALSVTSRKLSGHSAARYDYTPIWRTRQTTHSRTSVEEGWLEILGKPWYQDPYESISGLLSALSSGTRVQSVIQPEATL